MAVYKVIQDIEAEDKLIGPLTLKAFIYALIAAFLGFINWSIATSHGLGNYRWFLLLIFFWPMALFALLASPIGKEQPTEIWLLSHVRFFLKSRVRIWNPRGIKETVTITAPKKIDKPLYRSITQTEVHSRLKALATTMDSRGWAVKNVAINEPSLVDYLQANAADSDRLVSAKALITQQPSEDVHAADDVFDPQNNAKAKDMEKRLQDKDAERKQQLQKMIAKPKAAAKFIAKRPAMPAKSTTPPPTAKLKELAQSGNALSIASVAQLANDQPQQFGANEVVISLH